MKHIAALLIGLLSVLSATEGTPEQKYIDKYAPLAISEMERTGVPASITLAQGLLESQYGESELASEFNNHFGIKCHSDWKGEKTYYDDNRKGECFRVYSTAEESFKDHSDFLRYQSRYASLFDLAPTDYKGWARGLKSAGYAVTFRLINSLEYGAPQDRDRIILMGVKTTCLKSEKYDKGNMTLVDFPWTKHLQYTREQIASITWPDVDPFRAETHSRRKIPTGIIKELTCEYWFEKNDVEHHPNSGDYFTPHAGLVKMQTYSEGDVSRKCYKRLHRWRFSPTVAYGNNEVHLHPYKARRLSVAEALSLQSLPREYELPPDVPLSFKFKTIGNGVPFLAAYGIAKTLCTFLEEL